MDDEAQIDSFETIFSEIDGEFDEIPDEILFSEIDNEVNNKSTIKESLQQQDLKDRDLQRKLRIQLKDASFKILYYELVFLAILILFQGAGWIKLNDWVFGLITNVCILQTFLIIRYIALHLFPNNNGKQQSSK